MTETFFLQASAAFGAGLLSSLSPCVYPMIPLTVGFFTMNAKEGNASRRLPMIGFFIGQVVTFAALGMVAVTLGEIFGFSSESRWVQLLTAVLLFAMAYFSFKGELPGFLQGLNRFQPSNAGGSGIIAAFIIGSMSALIASPCTSPVLGAVLMTIASAGSQIEGAALMVFYAIGMSVLFLVLGLGLAKTSRLPRAGQWMVHVHRLSTVLLFGSAVYFSARGLSFI